MITKEQFTKWYRENTTIVDGEEVRPLLHQIYSFFSSSNDRVVEEIASLIQEKYEDKKKEPLPNIIPMACPSRSHYKERRQGVLSGILIARDIILSLIQPKEDENK